MRCACLTTLHVSVASHNKPGTCTGMTQTQQARHALDLHLATHSVYGYGLCSHVAGTPVHQSLAHCCEWRHGQPFVRSVGAVQSGGGGGASSSFMSSSSVVGCTTGGTVKLVQVWHFAASR